MGDAVSRRVAAQIWDYRNAAPLTDQVAQASVNIVNSPELLSAESFREKIELLQSDLHSIDVYARAADLQGGRTVLADLQDIQRQMREDVAAATKARMDIARLEKELEAEKRAKKRRTEYAAFAKVISKETSRKVMRSRIAAEVEALAGCDLDLKRIEKRKSAAEKEFRLLLQSALDLKSLAKTGFFGNGDEEDAQGSHSKNDGQAAAGNAGAGGKSGDARGVGAD